MPTVSTLPFIKPHFHNNAGSPANGYKLYSYDSTTQDAIPLYKDPAGSVEYTNPIILNSRGEPDGAGIYLDDDKVYKLILKTETNDLVWTVNAVQGVGGNGGIAVPVIPLPGHTVLGNATDIYGDAYAVEIVDKITDTTDINVIPSVGAIKNLTDGYLPNSGNNTYNGNLTVSGDINTSNISVNGTDIDDIYVAKDGHNARSLVGNIDSEAGAVEDIAIADTLASGSANEIPSVAAVKTYVDSKVLENTVDKIQFITNAGVTPTEGSLSWNEMDKTLNLGLSGGSVLQLGEEEVVYAVNQTGATISNGMVVYISGSQGNRVVASLAQAITTESNQAFIAVATQNIPNNQMGYFTTFGLVRDINTSSFAEGSILWVSQTAGQLTATRPPKTYSQIAVAIVTRSHAINGSIMVSPFPIPRLSQLTGVDLTSPANGQIIMYDSSTSLWKVHTPVISDITGLQTALDGKVALHPSGFATQIINGNVIVYNGSGFGKLRVADSGGGTTYAEFRANGIWAKVPTGTEQQLLNFDDDKIWLNGKTLLAGYTGPGKIIANDVNGHLSTYNGSAGSSGTPTYFDAGLPVACSSTLNVSITGNATTATNLGTTTVGTSTFPIYLNNGVATQCSNTLSNNISGNAATATKLGTTTIGSGTQAIYLNAGTATASTTTVGSATVPVFQNAGVTTACTSLSLNTTGNAATATKLATARSITLTGDIDGTATFDGSANISIDTTNPVAFDVSGSGTAATDSILRILRWPTTAGVYYSATILFTYAGRQATGENMPFIADVTYIDGAWKIDYTMIGNHEGYARLLYGVTGGVAEVYLVVYSTNMRACGTILRQSASMYTLGSWTTTKPAYLSDTGFIPNPNLTRSVDWTGSAHWCRLAVFTPSSTAAYTGYGIKMKLDGRYASRESFIHVNIAGAGTAPYVDYAWVKGWGTAGYLDTDWQFKINGTNIEIYAYLAGDDFGVVKYDFPSWITAGPPVNGISPPSGSVVMGKSVVN